MQNKWTELVQIWNKGDLVQRTVGHGSPGHPWDGWLVRNPWQENVEVIFKKGKVPRVLNEKEMRCKSGIIIDEKSTPKQNKIEILANYPTSTATARRF